MNNIHELCKELGVSPLKYKIVKNVTIIDDKNYHVAIKQKWKDKKKLYTYLDARGFNNYPKLLKDTKHFEVYPYLEDTITPREQKAGDLIYLMAILHRKTTFYKEAHTNKIKAFYEDRKNEINYLYQYYQTMQNALEKRIYPSPSEYMLLRNSSFFYQILEFISSLLERWYKEKESSKSMRYCLVHNNLSLDHYINCDNGYIISWDRASFDMPIYDFYNFYKNTFNLDYIALLEMYKKTYPLTTDEEMALYILLLQPKKLILKRDEFENCKEIAIELKRLSKIYENVLKKNKKDTEKEYQQLN